MFAMGPDESAADATRRKMAEAWGPMFERVKEGALMGTPEQAVEQIMAYVDGGADMVTIALRLPFEQETLEAYQEIVMPAVRAEAG